MQNTECSLSGVETRVESMEKVKNKRVLYHFAIFAIVNELLTIRNRRISPAYCRSLLNVSVRSLCDRGC